MKLQPGIWNGPNRNRKDSPENTFNRCKIMNMFLYLKSVQFKLGYFNLNKTLTISLIIHIQSDISGCVAHFFMKGLPAKTVLFLCFYLLKDVL